MSATQQLLKRVAARQHLASIGSRSYFFLLIFSGLYLVLLLVSRLLNVIPPWFEWQTLFIAPGLALVAAVIFHRRPTEKETARLVDTQAKTNDLFLTAVTIEKAAGDYKPLVLEEAARRAANITPKQITPFRWERRAAIASSVVTALVVAALLLPQLDPFGRNKEREKEAKRRQLLAESRKETEKRLDNLKQSAETGRTAEVRKSIEELLTTFKQMKPNEQKENLQRLAENQKELGKLWRELDAEKLRNAEQQAGMNQKFGANNEDLSKMKEELQKGETTAAKRQLEELKRRAEQLAKTTDSVEREKLKQELKKQLQGLSDALASQPNSQQAQAALARAMEQLDMADMQNLSQDAMQALQQTMQLTEQEMAALTQAIKDKQALEEALKALQMAKKLNDKEGLDGAQFAECNGLADYAEMYKKMMEQVRRGEKGGSEPNDGGIGDGSKRPEDDSKTSEFVPEQSKTALQAGKILLQWKTRGVSDPGKADEDFREAVKEIKEGWSEAVVQERVPPGYHDAIKKYFDTMDKPAPPPADKTNEK